MSPADFQTWLQKQIASAPPSPPAGLPGASGAPVSSGGAPAPSASTGGAPGSATTLAISAQNISFDTSTLTAPANTPFTIAFTNNDAGIPHDVQIHNGPNQSDPPIFEGEIFNGVGTKDYQVPALKPGTYAFSCKVHPSMTGTLTVQ
jgi:plastocyanin